MILPLSLVVAAFVVDRLSKWWVLTNFSESGVYQVHPLITIRLTYNRGIAFGLLPGIGPIVGWLSIVIVIGLLIYMIRLPRNMGLMKAGLAVLVGGALGNLVDRVINGRVLDFIETPLRPGIFNLADVMIYLGVFIFFVGILFRRDGAPQPAVETHERPESVTSPPVDDPLPESEEKHRLQTLSDYGQYEEKQG